MLFDKEKGIQDASEFLYYQSTSNKRVIYITLRKLFSITLKLKNNVLTRKAARVDWVIMKPN